MSEHRVGYTGTGVNVRGHASRPGGLLRRAWTKWASDLATFWPVRLAIAGMLLLFLEATATVEAVYTLRPSHLLFAAACLIGAPFVVQGWRRLPPALGWIAIALLAINALAALLGEAQVLPGNERGGEHRELVYLTDLALGLGIVGLVSGIWTGERSLLPAITALALGAGLAAWYVVYQWLALRFGWPLSDLNNAANAVSTTDTGLLGWRRAFGTFAEPHFLGAYLAMLIPIAAGLLVTSPRRGFAPLRVVALGTLGAMLVALAATGSLPAWVALTVGALGGAAVYLVAVGRPGPAALAGGALSLVVVASPVSLTAPETLTPLTGRQSLEYSTEFRTEAWSAATRTWATRPVLGYGPGQSAVRLADDTGVTPRVDPLEPPRVLGSAQGLWSASLVDTGLIGLAAWLLFLGGVVVVAVRSVLRQPSTVKLAILCAGITAILGSQVTGDRLELRVWVVVAILLAASIATAGGGPSEGHPAESRDQPQ